MLSPFFFASSDRFLPRARQHFTLPPTLHSPHPDFPILTSQFKVILWPVPTVHMSYPLSSPFCIF
ncbi:hypothetical protein PAXRUDRAFT_529141 [Paxillus rubicundulus Ve08.2h10]|uniref:Uncharacterized protein n=1 Tax=Paxillus rubicundulus Ve08.2h10 TaxID=930991 RepID=A0A0D0DBN4_9AGAM|nr:hypothetical protein PAXRUDRAFT_529141 [Paxillus rubicundulus Ve08.2h10]